MSDSIIVAIISSTVTLIGVLISNSKKDSVIETKLEILTDEVKKHNNFASRIPVLEEKVKNLENKIK